jgi:hypothetical protein
MVASEGGLRAGSKVCHQRTGQSNYPEVEGPSTITLACIRRWGNLSPMQYEQRWLAAQRKNAA